MKNLLEFLLIHIAQFPEDVSVESFEDERGVTFLLHVHPDDMGRIIGKNGSVIESIRKIAKVRAVKEGIRAYIKLAEPEDEAGDMPSNDTQSDEPQSNDNQDGEEVTTDLDIASDVAIDEAPTDSKDEAATDSE
jgi:uncharacterized protein